MLEFSHFAHVSLVVSDVERAKKFYGEVLGLNELPRPNFPFGGAWYSLGGKVELHLIHELLPFVRPEKPKPFNVRQPHLALWVNDADATNAALRSKGLSVETVLTGTGYRQNYIYDDDGHLIEFMGPTAAKD
jgi:catechol 2,3-dioxygenase-like lactoylglutathione lyase family enzyme